MAQKYYSMEEAAERLGLSPDEVRAMMDRRELHGYRDGATWKFKIEDIDRKAQEVAAAGASPGEEGADQKLAQFEEMDLVLDDKLSLEEPEVASSEVAGGDQPAGGSSDSAVDLSGAPLEDDDLVLGGSGTGSDVTLGGDSGISLVDPADSGLSLEEEPVERAGDEEPLELGEDDMLALAEDEGAAAVEEADFLLTPADAAADTDDSESGSQVIALDEEEAESPTIAAAGAGMAAMLDEDLGTQPVAGLEGLAPLEAPIETGLAPAGVPGAGEAVLPEAPYTAWNILALALCLVFLVLGGMFAYDLTRHVWSWDSPYTFNSTLMDWVLGLIEG